MDEQKTLPAEHIIAMIKGFLRACKYVPSVKVAPFNQSFYKDVLFYMEQISKDWLPIDYSQADSGKGCFDGKNHLLELVCKRGTVTGYVSGHWINEYTVWTTGAGLIEPYRVKRCRPIPSGWIGGV